METTMNQAILLLGRNIALSAIVAVAMSLAGLLTAYFAIGLLVSIILAIKKLPRFRTLINPIFYLAVFAMDLLLWPTTVIAEVATAYTKE